MYLLIADSLVGIINRSNQKFLTYAIWSNYKLMTSQMLQIFFKKLLVEKLHRPQIVHMVRFGRLSMSSIVVVVIIISE